MRFFLALCCVLVSLECAAAKGGGKLPRIKLMSPTGWELIIAPHGSAILSRRLDYRTVATAYLPEGTFEYKNLLAYFRSLYHSGIFDPIATDDHDPKKVYELALFDTDVIEDCAVLETDKIRAVFTQAGKELSEDGARRYAEARRDVPILPANE